jgi:F-type H+-transporting ATPase subunit beta
MAYSNGKFGQVIMTELLIASSPSGTAGPPCPDSSVPPLGVVEEVHGPVIDILCHPLPPLHQAVYVCVDGERYTFEVHRHLDESRARAIALHRTGGLRRLTPVFDTGGPLQVPVTPDCLGRLLDIFGRPLDGAA